MPFRLRIISATLAAVAPCAPAFAQSTDLPMITVTAPGAADSLVSPDTEEATRQIEHTPGAVAVIPDTVFKETPAQTVKDILDWVPGVFAQPRWGDDARVSIRGSGLSRNYGNRGIQMSMDGIPINTADGYVDLFEIDPSAYKYVEVYKGANALRYGANSLGGAVNYVTPTGRDAAPFEARIDAGSFGYIKGQASIGGVSGPTDWFFTGSAQHVDGYRDHSDGYDIRGSGNIGYRFSDNFETRFYLNANTIRQHMPGQVTKEMALSSPRKAADFESFFNHQRNIDSFRIANKSTLQLENTTIDFGAFVVNRHVMHPIFQWLDFNVLDYGGFVRAEDEREIGGFRNRLIAGTSVHNGTIDNYQYQTLPGAIKGPLVASTLDRSQNYSAYAENSFYFLPKVAFVAGTQFLHSVRDRDDRFMSDGDQSGRSSFDLWSPKLGLLYDVTPNAQIFANVSRSAEVPSFAENTYATTAASDVEAQTATTYEIGTRGSLPDVTWDLSLYRAEIRNELQCLTSPNSVGSCNVTNADRTVHQGIEAGLGVAVLKDLATEDDRLWLNLAYTYSDFHFDGDALYGDNRLPGAPAHYIRAELLYKNPSGFYAGPNVEWMPSAYYADNANQITVDPYALLNFRIGYDSGKGWSGYLEGRNLLDTRYISSTAITEIADAQSALFNPGTGRSVYAGARFTW